ncbi:PTS IIA-like nitrogen regulatory protein PtsN [Ferrimonas sediminicola]|uniref:PTS IIA-like nitrogen regulatory protein PtsN n=1 Tax=Ferrimonas sediminicola TaxID=2569538 RepID=A0A4U1BJ79_9GAMM|nr:PTS IIA-like nitrogen regulatory protein PtsN [Ferrimonas sediminicola]TKB51232.1 PTS IIA-like nitrogen regulatory protein PtsN [Ferrimonas sediminicola]
MELSTLLSPECATIAAPGLSKKRALEMISQLAGVSYPNLNPQQLFESLLARERMGSTGIGKGIALPHGRLSNIERPIAVFIKCDEAIPFDAIDGKPVDLLFALFVPEEAVQEHLTTLAAMAKVLEDKETCRSLRKCTNDSDLYALVTA